MGIIVPFGLVGSGRTPYRDAHFIAFILVHPRGLGRHSGELPDGTAHLPSSPTPGCWRTGSLPVRVPSILPCDDHRPAAGMLLVIVVVLFLSTYGLLDAQPEAERKASASLCRPTMRRWKAGRMPARPRDGRARPACRRGCDASRGRRAGMEDNGLRDLYRGSLLHDVGKMGIPEQHPSEPWQAHGDQANASPHDLCVRAAGPHSLPAQSPGCSLLPPREVGRQRDTHAASRGRTYRCLPGSSPVVRVRRADVSTAATGRPGLRRGAYARDTRAGTEFGPERRGGVRGTWSAEKPLPSGRAGFPSPECPGDTWLRGDTGTPTASSPPEKVREERCPRISWGGHGSRRVWHAPRAVAYSVTH